MPSSDAQPPRQRDEPGRLLQHARNPVDWFPWSRRARPGEVDRPIFLSIGYAACHWCHVMERESFEDPATAAYLNGRFVSVKVDREERPDLDQVYMAAVQGDDRRWRLADVGVPDAGRAALLRGTYFPNEARHGMPSFVQVLEGVDRAWREQRGEVEGAGQRLVEALVAQNRVAAVAAARPRPARCGDGRDRGVVRHPQRRVERPRVPAADDDRVPAPALCRDPAMRGRWRSPGVRSMRWRTGRPRPARWRLPPLLDDAEWLVPHFEQMLYDNAQLARVYIHAWR